MISHTDMAGFVRAAAAEVFSTMLGLEVQAGEAQILTDPPSVSEGVLSIIGLAGPWTGGGCISCSAVLARHICSQLLMTQADSVNEEVLDAVGEVTNMIIGNFKTMAEEKVGPLGLSIPTVIYGRNFTSRSIGQNEWVAVPFRAGEEELEVRVCLAPAKVPTAPRPGAVQTHPILS